MDLAERTAQLRFLIRDGDAKSTNTLDAIFASEGIQMLRTPVRAPRANAFAERCVRTVRRELLDRMLITGRRHLETALTSYVTHDNEHRVGARKSIVDTELRVRRRDPRTAMIGA
jgi:putative transposase